MFAAASGNVDAVTLLVDRGADVNAADRTHGQTPLMFAAAQGRDAAVKVLLGRKADPNAATQVSQIITMGERYKAKTDGKGTREITSEGGRSDITAMGGMTALTFAAREGHLAVVQALVAGGADVNKVQGADELSPITLAIINGRLDIGAYLLEHGANPNLLGQERRRPAVGDRGRPLARAHLVPAGEHHRGEDHAPRTAAGAARPRAPIRTRGSCASRGIAPSTATGPTRSARRRSGWRPRPTTSRRCGSWSPAAPIPASRLAAARRRCRWRPATASSRR